MSGAKELFFREGDEFELESFVMLPKTLFISPEFSGVSTEAKVLYSLMLERMRLSVKNGWFDEEKRAYIYFTIEDIMQLLHIGKDKSIKLLSELDETKGCGLIKRKRSGAGRPAIIYVKRIPDGAKNRSDRDEADIITSRTEDSGKAEVTASEKQKSLMLKSRADDFGKTAYNNTEYNNTYMSDTYSVLSYPENTNKAAVTAEDKMKDREIYKKIIRENIDYDILAKNYTPCTVDAIINIMLDAVCSSRESIIICRDKIPQAVVKSRLLKLSMFHIEYVLDCLSSTTTKIHNIKSYILTSLYNSYVTMEQYYTNSVNQSVGLNKSSARYFSAQL